MEKCISCQQRPEMKLTLWINPSQQNYYYSNSINKVVCFDCLEEQSIQEIRNLFLDISLKSIYNINSFRCFICSKINDIILENCKNHFVCIPCFEKVFKLERNIEYTNFQCVDCIITLLFACRSCFKIIDMHEKIFIISCEFDFFCSECIFNQSNKDTCLDCSRYFNNLPIEKVSHLRKKPKKIKVLIHDRHIEKFGIFFSKSNSSIPCDQCRTYVDVIKKKLNILEDDCDTYQSSLRSTSSYNGYLSLYPQANNIYPDLEPQRTEYSYGPNGIIYDNSFPYNMAQNYNNPYNYQQGFVGASFSNIPQQNFSNLSQNPQLAEYYSIVDNPYPYQHPHMAQGNIVINNGAGNYLNTQINNNIPQNIVNNSSQPLPIGSPTNYGGINIASQQYPFNNLTQQRDYSSQVPSMISNNVLRSGNLPQTNVLNNINKVEYNNKANANIPNLANNQILQVEPINPPLINYPLNKEENKFLYTQNFEEPHKCEKDTSSITSISVRRNPIIKCRSHKEVLLNLKCKHLICKKYIEQKLHNDFTKICRLANSLDTENLNLQNFSVDCPNEGCFSKYLYSIFEFQSQLDLIAREFQINRLLVEKILMLYEGYQKKFKLCQCRMIIFEDERCYCGR